MAGGGRRAAVTLLLVLLLLSLAATGCAKQEGRKAAPAPAPPPAAPVTEVLTFQAFDDVGLLPNLLRSTTVAGACQSGSVVHPGRADAWRCRAGDTAFDPCFANATGEELACVGDPWAREVTVLRPPAPLGRAGQNRNDPGLPPWYLELTDGVRCGRTPTAGYRCSTGAEVGEPDTSRPVWTVRVPGGAGPVITAEIRTAWY